MKIPFGPAGSAAAGLPTMYTSRLRAYGSGGFRMGDQEVMHGCPAQYKARYVDWSVPASPRSEVLEFGSVIHDVLFRMEAEAIGPSEALEKCWPPTLSVDRWHEAIDLLDDYLARGGPMAKYGTLAVELELYAQLYVDDEFGPVMFGGHLDWVGVDLDDPKVLHMVDYKTNQQPPSVADVKGDIQLMGYCWLLRECWQQLGLPEQPKVVAHLDAIRYREVEWLYSDDQLDEWAEWAAAISRTILRDDVGREILNPFCGWCPIQMSCETFSKLPGEGKTILERRSGRSLEQLVEWRDEAKTTIKILTAGVKEIDDGLKTRAEADGSVVVGGEEWVNLPSEKAVLDKERLREVIGDDQFGRLASFTKTALNEFARGNPELKSAIDGCWSKEVVGMAVARRKVESD